MAVVRIAAAVRSSAQGIDPTANRRLSEGDPLRALREMRPLVCRFPAERRHVSDDYVPTLSGAVDPRAHPR